MIKMIDLNLDNQRVLIRQDLNVPMQDGKITNDARLKAALPTIKLALEKGARVMIMSHLGRPTEGETNQQFSLQPVADRLTTLLNHPVTLKKDWLNETNIAPNEIVLCENVRFNKGEKANDENLSKQMASLCDVFVMDAFGTAHRAQASTHGVAKYATTACAGPLLSKELQALEKALKNPAKPMLAIVGGSKVSSKFDVLQSLIKKVDTLIVGGGIANTFIAAKGFNVGKSLFEADLLQDAKDFLALAEQYNVNIPIPSDVVVANEFSKDATASTKNIADITEQDMILDIGPETAKQFTHHIKEAGTILWNGPVGVFEFPAFEQGTKTLSLAIAESKAYSIAGGGDTLAAIDQFNITDKISYISTGGGAFLEFVEGKTLPAVAILEDRAHG